MFLASMREREKENEDIVELKSNADVLVRITFLYGPSFNFLQFPRVVRSLSLSLVISFSLPLFSHSSLENSLCLYFPLPFLLSFNR